MAIQIQFNSVIMDMNELQKHFPELAMMIQSSLPQKKKSKRRKRKKKKTMANFIDEVLENINSE